MSGRQVRLFVPMDAPQRWSDIMIDRIIRPIVNSGNLEWFWFTRYHVANRDDDNDCKWDEIPRAYKRLAPHGYSYTTRSMRFRFSVKTNVGGRYEKRSKVETEIEDMARLHEYWFSDFRDYDPMKDLGSTTMLKMCEAACHVVLENLDGTGKLKSYEAFRNLEQMHHRVCNISHLTDFRKLGFDLVAACMSDLDNVRYDSEDRSGQR